MVAAAVTLRLTIMTALRNSNFLDQAEILFCWMCICIGRKIVVACCWENFRTPTTPKRLPRKGRSSANTAVHPQQEWAPVENPVETAAVGSVSDWKWYSMQDKLAGCHPAASLTPLSLHAYHADSMCCIPCALYVLLTMLLAYNAVDVQSDTCQACLTVWLRQCADLLIGTRRLFSRSAQMTWIAIDRFLDTWCACPYIRACVLVVYSLHTLLCAWIRSLWCPTLQPMLELSVWCMTCELNPYFESMTTMPTASCWTLSSRHHVTWHTSQLVCISSAHKGLNSECLVQSSKCRVCGL